MSAVLADVRSLSFSGEEGRMGYNGDCALPYRGVGLASDPGFTRGLFEKAAKKGGVIEGATVLIQRIAALPRSCMDREVAIATRVIQRHCVCGMKTLCDDIATQTVRLLATPGDVDRFRIELAEAALVAELLMLPIEAAEVAA